MTVIYPDVSNWNAPQDLTGAPLVFAKASQGIGYTDPDYAGFKAQAARLGIPFGAYHWLDTTDAAAQARHAYSIVGPGVPLMIDDEQPRISVAHTLAFVAAYRGLGGLVTLEYLPRWTWSDSGTPDLRPLAAAGLHLVASDYNPTDAQYPLGLGWQPYGGVWPAILQDTDRWMLNGKPTDRNLFQGTLGQLIALIEGDPMATINQDDWDALIWRVEAILNNRPTVEGGPRAGEVNELAAELAKLSPAAATQQLVDQEVGKAFAAAQQAVTPPAA